MPDNGNGNGGGTPTTDNPPAGGTPPGAGGTPPAQDWDAVLAGLPEEARGLYETHVGGLKSALDSEREERKKLAKQSKEVADRLSKFEQADKKRRDAELSDLEKLQTEHDNLKSKYDGLVADRDGLKLRQAFFDELAAQKLTFPDEQARRDAYELADLSAAIDGGEIDAEAVTAAVKELQKTRPYLFGTAQPPSDDADKRGGGQVEATDEEVQEFAARYGLDPKHVDRKLLKKY